MTPWQHLRTALVPLARWLAAAGLLGLLGFASFGGIAAFRSGWIELPKQPERIIAPIRVTLVGPDKGVTGSTYIFTAEVEGDAGLPVWSVKPHGTLQAFNGGRSARFTCASEGDFLLSVFVGGDGKQAASDSMSFNVLGVMTEADLAAQEQIDQANQIIEQDHQRQAMEAANPPKPPTVSELVNGALNRGVDMNSAPQVEAQLRTLASRVQYGGADFFNDAALTLIGNYPGWGSFPDDVRSIVGNEEAIGRAKTPAGKAAVLIEIAETLRNSR